MLVSLVRFVFDGGRFGFVLAALATSLLCGGTNQARAEYSRKNAVTEAYQKTKGAVVMIKVEKGGDDEVRESTGTGVIVDERGYVVTSCHVVAGASKVRVHLQDETVLKADVLVVSEKTDLAILRVRASKPLKALPLGPGSDLMVGEDVIVVGNPFSYSFSVSPGIISALGRRIQMPTGDTLSNLIQTTAPINPGNSGGPLLNINGELIGIVAALREGAQGIAFAVNIDTVKELLNRQLSAVKVAGVQHGLACSERVRSEGTDRQQVVVGAVSEETPAAKAGLKRGDRIVRVATRNVSNRFDVERALWEVKPGQNVAFAVVRDGKEISISLTLAAGETKVAAAN